MLRQGAWKARLPCFSGSRERDFAAAVQVLGWSNMDLQSYSVRMAATTMRGRWADFSTRKLYANAALQDRAGLDMQHRAELGKPMPS